MLMMQITKTVDLKGYIDTTDRSTLILSNSLSHEFEVGTVEHALLLGAEYISTSNDNDRTEAVTSSNYSIGQSIGGIFGVFDYSS